MSSRAGFYMVCKDAGSSGKCSLSIPKTYTGCMVTCSKDEYRKACGQACRAIHSTVEKPQPDDQVSVKTGGSY